MESRESEFSEVYVFRMSSKLLKSSLGENGERLTKPTNELFFKKNVNLEYMFKEKYLVSCPSKS